MWMGMSAWGHFQDDFKKCNNIEQTELWLVYTLKTQMLNKHLKGPRSDHSI